MEQLFGWHYVFFNISLMIGFLLLIGSAFGLIGDVDIDHDFDHDIDHDFGHDIDHGHELEGDKDSSALDVGRVPFTVLLMLATLIFGTAGWISNIFLSQILVTPMAYGWISIGLAFLVMLFLTKRLARLIGKYMPSTETYNVSQESFRGCTAKLTLPTNNKYGAANLKDREGNIHSVTCRTREGALPTGTEVLVLDYLSDEKVCIVQAVSELDDPQLAQ